jgi:methyl-accepting chemotaxis protein
VNLNESVKRHLEEIRSGVQGAAAIMHEIAEGAASQEKELAEVTESMGQIGGLTQRTAANAEESASAAAELSAQARDMHELAIQFNVGDGYGGGYAAAPEPVRAEPVSRASVGAGRPPRGTSKPAAKTPPRKSVPPAERSVPASAPAAGSAAAMIPFDDDDANGDDVLNSF